MGILDNLAGMTGQQQNRGGGGTQQAIIAALMAVINSPQVGGLSGLISRLTNKGLGKEASSWVSTGNNVPVSPDQVQQGLGSDIISQLAAKAGLSQEQVATHLSGLLPTVVDKLTPDGKVDENRAQTSAMDLLGSLFK